MPRTLRLCLFGLLAITFAYLTWHAFEPLRLNVGDPWADAELVSTVTGNHSVAPAPPNGAVDSPLSMIVYSAVAKLGINDIAVFRLFALVISALGAWSLFHYLRRMWNDSIALLGTTLFATSLLSLMHADTLQALPFVHASCFIALWGVVRATETEQLRHYAAATLGSFACMFAGSDDWLFLATGAVSTVLVKRGDPLERGNFRLILVCAVGGIAGMLASSHVAVDAVSWQRAIDDKIAAPVVPLLNLTFAPLLWIAVACGTWHALRSPTLRAVLDDAMSWLVVVAVIAVYLASPRSGPPLLRAVSVLPFYAVAVGLWIDRLLQRGRLARGLAIAWIAAAPAWAFAVMIGHTRSVLERDDVAATRAYLAANDGNDFVLSNLLSYGVVHGAFDRRGREVLPDNEDATADRARVRTLELLDAAGADYVHAVIFTTPESRFVDRTLGELPRFHGLHLATAYPYLRRERADDLIRAYDDEIRDQIDAVGARRVLHFDNFDVYRIDRRSIIERAGQAMPVTRAIDFTSPSSIRYELHGWHGPRSAEGTQLAVTSIAGYGACTYPQVVSRIAGPPRSACETVVSDTGVHVPDVRLVDGAQLVIRVDHVCDLRMTVDIEPVTAPLWLPLDVISPVLELSINDLDLSQCAPSRQASFDIPKRYVHDGVNVVTFATRRLGALMPRADLRALHIECADR